jgi:hypothetical protein
MPTSSYVVALLERLAADRHVPELAGEPGTERLIVPATHSPVATSPQATTSW